MSVACKCDRCGACSSALEGWVSVESYQTGERNSETIVLELDLCPPCAEQLNHFLESPRSFDERDVIVTDPLPWNAPKTA